MLAYGKIFKYLIFSHLGESLQCQGSNAGSHKSYAKP